MHGQYEGQELHWKQQVQTIKTYVQSHSTNRNHLWPYYRENRPSQHMQNGSQNSYVLVLSTAVDLTVDMTEGAAVYASIGYCAQSNVRIIN